MDCNVCSFRDISSARFIYSHEIVKREEPYIQIKSAAEVRFRLT